MTRIPEEWYSHIMKKMSENSTNKLLTISHAEFVMFSSFREPIESLVSLAIKILSCLISSKIHRRLEA
jgi:hypothetical protein